MLQRLHDLLDRVYCFSILTLTLFESSSDTNQVKVYTLSCRALNARLQFPKPNLNRCVLQYFRWRKGLNNQTFEHRMLLHHHSPSHSTVNKLFWSQLLHYIPGKLIHIFDVWWNLPTMFIPYKLPESHCFKQMRAICPYFTGSDSMLLEPSFVIEW